MTGQSTSGVWSTRDAVDSRHVSLHDDSEFQAGSSSTFHYPGPSLSAAMPTGRTASRSREADGDDTGHGRKHKWFSFTSALLEVSCRARASSSARQPLLRATTRPPRGCTMHHVGARPDIEPILIHKEMSTLDRVSETLGFEVEKGPEQGDGWKVLRQGAPSVSPQSPRGALNALPSGVHGPALLPLMSDDQDTFQNSPLFKLRGQP